MEYRTQEQFDRITDSMINGNWSEAIEYAVEFGFSAVDLKQFADNTEYVHDHPYIDISDYFYVCEGIGKNKRLALLAKYKSDR